MMPNFLDLFHGDDREHIPDFAAARRNGIFAVCHKATQGIDYVDPKYHVRQNAAQAAGMIWGAYHFGDASDEQMQLRHFLAVVMLVADFFVLDFEDNRQNSMALNQAQVFMRTCDERTGRKTWLYSGNRIREALTHSGGHQQPDMTDATGFFGLHPLWLAEYGPVERVPLPWTSAIAWQYSESGSVPGIAGHVDLNHIPMTEDQFRHAL
jgi:lysozyme